MSIVDYISSLATPDCCMSYGGVKFEELIPGYRTNSVTGRDSLASEVTESTNKFRDGADLERLRHQSRDITVTATLVSETVQDHRKNLDLLKGFLHVYDPTEVDIIFDDESDVQYFGVITNIQETPLAVDGYASTVTITIHCSKPYKYSVKVYEAENEGYDEPDGNGGYIHSEIITINYRGTAKSYPDILIQPDLEFGFLGLVNQYGDVLQLGNPDELDLEHYGNKSKEIANSSFSVKYSGTAITGTSTNPTVFANSGIKKAAAGDRYMNTSDQKNIYTCTTGGDAKTAKWKYVGTLDGFLLSPSGWTKNDGVLYQTSPQNWPLTQAGAFTYQTKNGLKGLYPGTTGNGNAWHGPSLKYTIASNARKVNCQFGWYHYFAMQTDIATNNLGCQQFVMLDENNQVIAACDYRKNKANNKDCLVQFFIGTEKVGEIPYIGIGSNTISGRVGDKYGNSKIQKFGGQFIFDINGTKYQFYDGSFEEVKVASVVAYAAQSAKSAKADSIINALKILTFESSGTKDIPNPIQPDEEYLLECETGKIFVSHYDRKEKEKESGPVVTKTLRGQAEAPELGAFGNDWEAFCLLPGHTMQFKCLYSQWYQTLEAEYVETSIPYVIPGSVVVEQETIPESIPWEPNVNYHTGQVVQYGNMIFSVSIGHTSSADRPPGNEPDDGTVLYDIVSLGRIVVTDSNEHESETIITHISGEHDGICPKFTMRYREVFI